MPFFRFRGPPTDPPATQVDREWGGPWGIAFMIVTLPLAMFILWLSCLEFDGQLFVPGLWNVAEWPTRMWRNFAPTKMVRFVVRDCGGRSRTHALCMRRDFCCTERGGAFSW